MKKILFILFLLLPSFLQADQEQNMYQVEALVADQSSGERIKGMSAAIKEVLVRVSGNKSVIDEPELSAAIVSPGRYIEGYRYEKRQQGNGSVDFLLVSFSAQALQNLLVEKNLPVWSAQRPNVLVWLAVERQSRPYIAKDSPLNTVNQAINRASTSRGLPLSWPLDTDVDSGKVRVADITAGFVEQIVEASRDYSAHAILIGHVKELSGSRWQGKWRLVRDGQSTDWDSDVAGLDSVVSDGIDVVADTIAAELSISSRDEQQARPLLVKVRNLDSLEGYAAARAYLYSLLVTSEVKVAKVYAQAVEYQLRLRGTPEEFARAIRLGGTMRVVPKVIEANHIEPSQRLGEVDPGQPDFILELVR